MPTKQIIDETESYSQKIKLITPILKRYCASKIFDSHDWQDIVQSTLFILCKKQNQYDANKSFYSWALTICNFQIKMYMLYKKRNREDIYSDFKSFHSSNMFKNSVTPFCLCADKQDHSELLKKIETIRKNLPPRQSEAFGYFLKGIPRKTICKIMNMKEKTLNITYLRLIKNAQKILEDTVIR